MQKNHISQIDPSINVKSFGLLADGTEINCYTLTNKNGLICEVLNYGATIKSLMIPTSTGKVVDVVLGFETIEDYVNSFQLPNATYFGTVVGRYAGRINQGQFEWNGKHIQLSQNHNQHQIHGGIKGFSLHAWEVIDFIENENPSITLQYISPDGEEGYPAEVRVEVQYTLTEMNELQVNFKATSSEDSVINLTQHSYFNLNGHQHKVIGQQLQVHSNQILETTKELIPTGNFISLKDNAFDFSSTKDCPTMIDTTFVLSQPKAAVLFSEQNQLQMSVTTNQPAVHIYVGGNCFDQIKGKEGAAYHPLSGICFEAQNYPDAPNHSHFPSSILKKGATYQHQTAFKFEIL